VRAVEREGFEDWYRSQHRAVLGALVALSGDVEVAREATDEAFARALERWSDVQGMASPGGWVYQVALNVLRRTSRRRATAATRLLGRPNSASDPHLPRPEVWAAVRALPIRQRTAVVLRYVADLAEADIAVAMGVTRGTVAASLAAARKRLADELHDVDNDAPTFEETRP
jgi:RNA polymerase sigma factor (sigma-70 family)